MNPGVISKSIAFVFLLSVTASVLPDESVSGDDESQIRQAREAFNQAICDQDVDAIEQFSAPEYHIITGRSAQSHGKENVRSLREANFTSASDQIC